MPEKYTKEKIINKIREKHGDNIEIVDINELENCQSKVRFKCRKCGYVWITRPYSIIAGHGCRRCYDKRNSERRIIPLDIINDKIVKNGSNVQIIQDYIDTKHYAKAKCNLCGNVWKTSPRDLIRGHSCPMCNESHLEREIRHVLEKNNINYEYQKKFEWLSLQSLDFYLSEYNIAIECQGMQHFMPVEHFGGEENFISIQGRDKRKKRLCKENGVELIYFLDKKYNSYMKEDDIYFNKKEDLLKYIKLRLDNIIKK